MAKLGPRRIKRGHKATFFVTALTVILLTVLCFTGLTIPKPGGGRTRIYGASEMRYGIDIRGGVEAIYAPNEEGFIPNEAQMNAIQNIMEFRMDKQAIYDRDIILDRSNGRIIVRFPWKSDETDFNPVQAMKELGETARLTFRDPQGTVILTGADVQSAAPVWNSTLSQVEVSLKLTAEGAQKFAVATAALVNQQMGIYMDDDLISNPVVQQVITGGEASISPMESEAAAIELANKINAGALPFDITAISSSSITPMMGRNALQVMTQAGLWAFIILCVFLLFYYRLSGLVACFALLMQVVGILMAIAIPQQTLTLQGIAGIILSIGMGVDANVIIAERIKEEARKGITIRTAVSYGFDRAFSSILDGNVTVAIAAVCLMVFGTGSMLSFAYSLLVGVILNLICGAFLSHIMTRSLIEFKALRKPWFFNAGGRTLNAEEVSA
ncbi:MAG: protein translocase subunit SecD [Clostridiaceae bacterium]|nr:protein translocase subunit SecD [Clostridiaceae bacterium]